jgi:hypothetical protein
LWWSDELPVTLLVVGSLAMSLTPSRRRLLQAAALSPFVAACTSGPARPARVDPDDALRAAAVAREQALLEQYAAAVGASPAVAAQLAAVRAEHEQHLVALGVPAAGSSPPSPSPSPLPTAAGSAVPSPSRLAAAERTAAASHAAAALVASPSLAPLLASLAASEASHPVALL